MARALASNFLTLLIVILVIVLGMIAWLRDSFTAPGPLAQPACVRVEQGDRLPAVSRRLATEGVVANASVFRLMADYSGKAGQLKFGSYTVPAAASMEEVLERITAGGASTCGRQIVFRIGVTAADVLLQDTDLASNRFVEVARFDPATEAAPQAYVEAGAEPDVRYSVQLVEGVTSWQVVESLKRADFLTGDVAEVPPEGSLAPDSYEVDRGSDRNALIAAMQARQTATMDRLWPTRAADLPYDTPEEAMVMASIVEKETGIASERGQVASVFVNRLRQGMRLQTDPTVIYGVTNGQAALGRGLRQSELRRETPYNTYVIDGLPPTPIANPGEASIAAALNPDATDYLFFVADGTGGHAFARTLAEHNENVATWRRIEAERAAQTPEAGVTGVQSDE